MNRTTTNKKALKAEIATVPVGSGAVEGLLIEDGRFAIAVPQVSRLDLVRHNQASRDLKLLQTEDFQFDIIKVKTPLNPKPVNAVLLPDFEKILAKLDRKGNIPAQILRDELVGLSFHQLFCDAFKIKFEQEERQDWLRKRQETKHSFHPLTDQLKSWGFVDGYEYACFISAFQKIVGFENGTRDNLDPTSLIKLQSAQTKVTSYMECGIKPWDALEKYKQNPYV